jgi:signal transduction histidine kinase
VSRIVRALALLAVTGAVTLGVLEHRRKIDARAHDRYARDVRQLEALDARLSFEVMRSRDGLAANYDDVVDNERSTQAILARLRHPPSHLGRRAATTVTEAVGGLTDAVSEKEELIEHFKSENAVLRNSVRFFPVAAEALRDDLDAEGLGGEARKVNDVVTSVLRFEQTPGSETELARAQGAIDTLATSAPPSWADVDTDVVLSHAQNILDRGTRVNELTSRILTVPAGPRAIEVGSAYEHGYGRALSDGTRRRSTLFAFAIAAVVLVGVDIIIRLRRSAVKERAANETLARANEALFREKERERELRELKSRFVSMTSHEFRTPLSVILSSTELLEAYGERWTAAKRADHYSRIKKSVHGMTELLDGILVIGRAEMGKLEHNPSPFDIGRWARGLADAFRPTVGKKHAFETELEGDFDDAWGDEKLLNHIFTNLLSNAVKYSPEGGTVRFSLKRDGDNAVFVVSDEGIGIPEADRPRLFESFHRGDNVGAIPGTGLGLAVVKRALEAAGGDIDLATASGKGTTFTVTVPIGPPAAQDDPGAREEDARPQA